MTVERLREFKNAAPFKPFTIHMNNGTDLLVRDPESLIVHPDWTMDAIVILPGGKFSFVYLRNVSHVPGQGSLPKLGVKKRRGKSGPGFDE
jgi:hypothetical protein